MNLLNLHLPIKQTVLLFISLGILSCQKAEERVVPVTEEGKSGINYLALGDSYTIGQGVTIGERWPIQLGQRLQENNIAIKQVDIIAQTGWTTANLLAAIEKTELDLSNYQLVSLLIGVNNQYSGQSFSVFETEFLLLLQKAILIAGSKDSVFVLSIPDYGVTPFGQMNSEIIAREIDQYNTFIKNTCLNQGVAYIDITAISRELGDAEGALATDNLHPSGLQYSLWVEKALAVVLELLNHTSE